MSDLADFYVHTIHVQTLTGVTAYGKAYAAAAPVVGYLERKQSITRSADGDTAISVATFFADASTAALFTTGSKATIPEPVEVLSVAVFTSGALGLPDHVEVKFT
jgi:hypothetical protein